MSPEHAKTFGGGAGETSLNPIVLCALMVAVILILMLPRKYVIWPMFFLIFLSPLSEQVVLGGVHLYMYRIIVLVGLSRMLWTKFTAQTSILSGGMNSIDRAFIWCGISQACAVTLLFLSGNALINQCGFLLDSLGGYLLLRFLIRDEDDVYQPVRCLAFLASIFGFCMLWEHFTLHNLFASIGGQAILEVRNDMPRAQGPFGHNLMAGTFGATVFPLCVLLWKSEKAKAAAVFGLVGSVLMVWTSNGSTSILTCAAAIVAIFLWPIRKSMRAVRWGIVFGLISLQLVMKAPVWYVLAHIDLTGGSSSYHRAQLIDLFLTHFTGWWLMGVRETGSWGWDMWDTQNQFVNVGQTGGLLPLILFITLISFGFKKLGDARKAISGDSKKEWILWLLGAALFSNVVAFFGVNYFDQTMFAWFALLAMISAATAPLLQTSLVPEWQGNIAQGNSRLAYSSSLLSRSPAQLKSRIS